MSELSPTQPRVGIDLVPAGLRHRAAGTARHIEEQARALFSFDVPWKWVPVIDGPANPLFEESAKFDPVVHPVRRISLYACFELGRIWKRAGCVLGFGTSCFAPYGGPPLVSNFFDSNPYESVNLWWRQRQPLRARWLLHQYGRTVRTARTLFINSNYCRQRMTAIMPAHAHKFVIAPCGVFARQPAVIQQPEWAAQVKKPYFLYVGTACENKNQHRLLVAWQQLQTRRPDAPALVLMGPCTPEYRAAVLDPLLRALPRPADVHLLGFRSENELRWAYQYAHAYIQPSITEGFGLPVAEAMAQGLPVACSNTTSLPETAAGAALLFDPLQPAEIAQTAERLWLDDALRADLVQRGRIRVRQLSWHINAQIVAREIHRTLQQLGHLPPGEIPDFGTSPRRDFQSLENSSSGFPPVPLVK